LWSLVDGAPAQTADGETDGILSPFFSFSNCAASQFSHLENYEDDAGRSIPQDGFSQPAPEPPPISPVSPMTKTPEIGKFLDAEEQGLVRSFETSGAPLKSVLNPRRKREIELMARAAMTDERAKISLRVPKRDLTRLKSRALQEGIPYQTLINALIHKYVTD
jgi:predicted DNA binding CopG/RHH family protein